MDEVGAIVVGAGVVGLAVARALALVGHEVMILERERQFGTITSARNSGVIHAGLYYPEGSLKAALCVEGRRLLYDFCESRGVAQQQCALIVVARGTSRTSQERSFRWTHHGRDTLTPRSRGAYPQRAARELQQTPVQPKSWN